MIPPVDAHAAKITAGELVVALSHYDLGAIHSLRRFRGGSRSSPKIILDTDSGRYLMKRRPPGAQSALPRVAFTHEVVRHLAARDFPVPRLIPTRSGSTILELSTGVYELYTCIQGERYARTPDQALGAGWWLARCHIALTDLAPIAPAPTPAQSRSFHAHPRIVERIGAIPDTLAEPECRGITDQLAAAYSAAADAAQQLGAPAGASPAQVIHGDYHPGNLLFAPTPAAAPVSRLPSGARLVAGLFDFDSARKGDPLHELANGAMQFAVHRQFDAPGASSSPSAHWRIALDPALFRAFFAGYGYADGPVDLRSEAIRAVPHLMIEALIVEAVIPIANTGRFGKLKGRPVLEVVLRAAEALAASADKLVDLARAARAGP